jgi:hypothetical protein
MTIKTMVVGFLVAFATPVHAAEVTPRRVTVELADKGGERSMVELAVGEGCASSQAQRGSSRESVTVCPLQAGNFSLHVERIHGSSVETLKVEARLAAGESQVVGRLESSRRSTVVRAGLKD